MGFKDWLPGTRYINDDFFGELSYFKFFSDKGLRNCIAKRHFALLKYEIDISMLVDKHGPNLHQKDFFRKIESSYHELINGAMPMIISYLDKTDRPYTETEFISEFIVTDITLPTYDESDWQLIFKLPYSELHHLYIDFEAFNVVSYIEID